jgi:nucleoporin NUP82
MAPAPTLVPSLANLSKHSIFIPPVTSKTKPEPDWELLDAPEDDVPLKTSRMVVRDKDLIVAHGKEIRIANTGGDGWEVHDGQLGWYKVSCPAPLPGSCFWRAGTVQADTRHYDRRISTLLSRAWC